MTVKPADFLEDDDTGGKKGHCISMETMRAVAYMLESSFGGYKDANNGYDEKFAAYTRYVKSMIPFAVDGFMQGEIGGAGEGMKCRLTQCAKTLCEPY